MIIINPRGGGVRVEGGGRYICSCRLLSCNFFALWPVCENRGRSLNHHCCDVTASLQTGFSVSVASDLGFDPEARFTTRQHGHIYFFLFFWFKVQRWEMRLLSDYLWRCGKGKRKTNQEKLKLMRRHFKWAQGKAPALFILSFPRQIRANWDQNLVLSRESL